MIIKAATHSAEGDSREGERSIEEEEENGKAQSAAAGCVCHVCVCVCVCVTCPDVMSHNT